MIIAAFEMAVSAIGCLAALIAFAWTFPAPQRFVKRQIYKYKVWRWGSGRLYVD